MHLPKRPGAGERIAEPCADQISIQTMTTMLMGYKRPTYLYQNERIQADYHLIPYLERLIPIEKPYFSDYF